MKKNNGIVYFVAVCIVFSLMISSCVTIRDTSRNYDLVPEIHYQNLLDLTIVSTGNNYRLKKVLQKLSSGEDVYIAALGGSVTEGLYLKNYKNGYAYQFYRKMRDRFTDNNGTNMHFLSAGLGGTPSIIGLIRYYTDVVERLGHVPDLLVIEFSVNDDDSSLNARAFEQLIRNALSDNEETAVIALYSASTYGNQSSKMIPIASYYGIPQVNVLNLYEKGINEGFFTKEKYFIDAVHPTIDAHNLQAECLINIISRMNQDDSDIPVAIPMNCYNNKPFDDFHRITKDSEELRIDLGSFNKIDLFSQSMKSTHKGDFPSNWKHGVGLDSLSFDLDCKALVVVFKLPNPSRARSYGNAEVFVDGKRVKTLMTSNGGVQCGYDIVIDEEESSRHHVEIKMAEEDAKKKFTILAMGYSK